MNEYNWMNMGLEWNKVIDIIIIQIYNFFNNITLLDCKNEK